jgi:thymidine kinase
MGFFYPKPLLASFSSTVSNTQMNKTHSYLKKWHEGLVSNDPKLLDEILDESCIFTSPIVFKPIVGKEMSKLYLMGAGQTFDMDRFKYVRELVDGLDSVLEFETYIGDISVNGVDIIRWNDEGKIVDFKVMIRPLQAIGALQEKMSQALKALK